MKILVLGATGRTGKFIIEEALKKGHYVTAIARDPAKLEKYKIDIIQGTPYDYDTLEKALNGCDAVINTLNVSRRSDNPWAPLTAPKDLIVSISNLKYAFIDHGKQEKILENSSIEYTICRAPMLSIEINTSGAAASQETENPQSMKLSRNSAAEFFIKIIENREYIRQTVNLSNNR